MPPIQLGNLVAVADGFLILGGLGCADTLANPLQGLFFSPVTVALHRDEECNNSS